MSSGVVISPSLDFGEIICCQSLTARLVRLSKISIPKYEHTSWQNGSLRAPQCATTTALLYLTGCKFENRVSSTFFVNSIRLNFPGDSRLAERELQDHDKRGLVDGRYST